MLLHLNQQHMSVSRQAGRLHSSVILIFYIYGQNLFLQCELIPRSSWDTRCSALFQYELALKPHGNSSRKVHRSVSAPRPNSLMKNSPLGTCPLQMSSLLEARTYEAHCFPSALSATSIWQKFDSDMKMDPTDIFYHPFWVVLSAVLAMVVRLQRKGSWDPRACPVQLTGKTAIVTGANTGRVTAACLVPGLQMLIYRSCWKGSGCECV